KGGFIRYPADLSACVFPRHDLYVLPPWQFYCCRLTTFQIRICPPPTLAAARPGVHGTDPRLTQDKDEAMSEASHEVTAIDLRGPTAPAVVRARQSAKIKARGAQDICTDLELAFAAAARDAAYILRKEAARLHAVCSDCCEIGMPDYGENG